ncbi:cytochrome P450 [Actinophytocola oryzae]|uniref:Cytochrome P450 n=1 Tax=Actinophytocola oryzae TaxID=502181 RepID=A0A4R7UUU9_9PSEU|nr:cytochrome P450 [Actinophytocola oryzae]TDV37794.1 cytochrome P450 [Actinophytocola oryzae]
MYDLGPMRAFVSMNISRAVLAAFSAAGDPAAQVLGNRPPVDPYPLYERIRARGELCRSRLGIYLTASYAVSSSVLRDQRFGVVPDAESSGIDWNLRPGDAETLVHPVEHSLLMMNPPQHTRLRKLAAPWFTPRALSTRVDRIERIVEHTLDEIGDREQFDIVADFAVRVVIRVICDLFEVPDTGIEEFARWGGTLAGTIGGLRSNDERRRVRATLVQMTAFFEDVVERRRATPGDDVISSLVSATVDGAPLARRDLLALCGLLLAAGFETTVNVIGNGVLALMGNDDVRHDLLAAPELAGPVLEEVLRFDSPVQYTAREALEPVRLAGVDLPRGAMVVVLIGGANRDPAVFDDPARFDPARSNNRDHLSFSSGIHYCLAAGLGRIEGEVALRRLFTRFPDLRIVGPVPRQPKRNIRGPQRMVVATGTRRRAGTEV